MFFNKIWLDFIEKGLKLGNNNGIVDVLFLEVKKNDDVINLGKLDLKVVLVVMGLVLKILEENLGKDKLFFDFKFDILGVKLMFVFNKIKD